LRLTPSALGRSLYPFLSSPSPSGEQNAYVTRDLNENQKDDGPTNAPQGNKQCPRSQGTHGSAGQVGGKASCRWTPVFPDDFRGHRELIAAKKSKNETVAEEIEGVNVGLEKAGPSEKNQQERQQHQI
jgi:hypothetical protein